jgi:hypothetical protein
MRAIPALYARVAQHPHRCIALLDKKERADIYHEHHTRAYARTIEHQLVAGLAHTRPIGELHAFNIGYLRRPCKQQQQHHKQLFLHDFSVSEHPE